MTKEEARAKARGKMPELRSCWNCNLAHEHLKDHELILCLWCSHYYFKGIDLMDEPWQPSHSDLR